MSYIPSDTLPDNSVFTEGTSNITPVGGEYNDGATAATSGNAAVARITPNRALHANLRSQSGAEIGTSGAPVRVDPTGTTTQPVSGSVSVSNFPATQPVSAAALPLPSGAATSAKQPALGVAGTPSVDVLTVQGAAAMTAFKVDGSGVTQPVSLAGWSVSSQTGLLATKTQVKAAAGAFGGYMLYNPNSVIIYVQVFDTALASVTVGSTTPKFFIPIPPTGAANLEITKGITHTTAIVLAATTTPTGSGAPASGIVGFVLFS